MCFLNTALKLTYVRVNEDRTMKKLLIILFVVIAAIIGTSFFAIKHSEKGAEAYDTTKNYEDTNSDIVSYFAKLEEKQESLSDIRFKIITKLGDNTTTSDYYKKKAKKRLDNKTGDIETISIFDSENNTVTTYLPAEKKAFVETYDSSQNGNSMFGNMKNMDKTGLIKGEETEINGYTCQMFTSKDDGLQLCVSEEYALPIYANANNHEMQIKDISLEPIDEEVFTLPKDVQVIKK